MVDYRDNTQECQDYIHALEEEQRKIQVFQRELPLCLQLVTQTIEAYKQQLSGTTAIEAGHCFNGGQAGKQQQSECSEQTTSDGGPILEEFIPINRTCSSVDHHHADDDGDDDDDELLSQNPKTSTVFRFNNGHQTNDSNNGSNSDKSVKKSDWLRSAQLWNQTIPDPPSTTVPTKEEHQPKKVSVVEVKQNGGNGGAFQPFQKHNTTTTTTTTTTNVISKPASTPTASACSTAVEAPAAGSGGARSDDSGNNGGGACKKDEKECGQRKARRCWSQELHRKFLSALQQLGGSHVATPKQIRELMKVDGLTNDEVKSHLQKYRLHTRRPTPIHHNSSIPSTQAPQFIVVGGLWVPPPPPEYTTALAETASTSAPNGIYTPNATTQQHTGDVQHSGRIPEKKHSRNSDEIRNHRSHDVPIRSNSPSTSSSTHTTTASQAAF